MNIRMICLAALLFVSAAAFADPPVGAGVANDATPACQKARVDMAKALDDQRVANDRKAEADKEQADLQAQEKTGKISGQQAAVDGGSIQRDEHTAQVMINAAQQELAQAQSEVAAGHC